MRLCLATTLIARARGLLGRRRAWLGDDGALMIVPCSSIHTFGMREKIDVAFLGADGMVLRSEEEVLPMRLLGCRKAVAVLERFSPENSPDGCLSSLASAWVRAGDSVGLKRVFGNSVQSFCANAEEEDKRDASLI